MSSCHSYPYLLPATAQPISIWCQKNAMQQILAMVSQIFKSHVGPHLLEIQLGVGKYMSKELLSHGKLLVGYLCTDIALQHSSVCLIIYSPLCSKYTYQHMNLDGFCSTLNLSLSTLDPHRTPASDNWYKHWKPTGQGNCYRVFGTWAQRGLSVIWWTVVRPLLWRFYEPTHWLEGNHHKHRGNNGLPGWPVDNTTMLNESS